MALFKLVNQKRLPILSLLLSIVLVLCFFAIEKHDQSIFEQATSQYQQQNLLKVEGDAYVEFIERRLNIEQLGTQANLDKIYRAAQAKTSDQFITLLLNDRAFYSYILAEGRLFMSGSEFSEWQAKRESIINPIVTQLYSHKFALNLAHYGISNFISHLFVETSRVWLAVNILLLLVCGGLIECCLTRGKLVLLLFGATFIGSIFYLLLAGKASPSLQGGGGAVFACLGANLVQLCISYRNGSKAKLILALALLLLLSIASYLGALWFWQEAEVERLSLLGLMLVVGASFYRLLWQLELLSRPEEKEVSEIENRHLEQEYRTALAQVMAAISIFNFDLARAQLKAMSQRFPNLPEVIEQRYHIEKLYPDEGFYWQSAQDLVNYAVAHNDYERMMLIFEDTQKNASSKQQAKASLAPEYYHKMLMVFVAHNDLNSAEKAFLFLELAGQIDIIKEACLLLIHEFKSRGIRVKQQQYQMLFERILL